MIREMKLEVNAGSVVACVLWTLSLVTWGVGWIIDSSPVRVLSIIICVAAATATTRTYFVRQCHMMRDSFELGRDSVTTMARR